MLLICPSLLIHLIVTKNLEIMKHFKNIILLVIGLFIIYWAMEHSPKAGLGQVISNEFSGSYTMSETWYYVSLVCGAALAIVGGMRIFKNSK
jgi:hypothetical protein